MAKEGGINIKLDISYCAFLYLNKLQVNGGSFIVVFQWSYGVTCWEIFNGGRIPYPGIHPADLPQQLDKGLRLEKPPNAACTNEM